jgi:dolichol-phosphate mannosyltransferase
MENKSTTFSLSIVMPCLNEEENLGEAIANALTGLDDFQIRGDVIVVNDGSEDNSLKIAESFKEYDDRVIILDKKRRQGIGKAFWDGSQLSNSDFVVMIPGDNENRVSEVLNYFDLGDRVDLIVPFVPNSEVRHIARRIISGTYRWIVNLGFGTQLNYTNGTVIYNRAALMSVDLSSNGFFYQTELLIKLLRQGFLYAEVPQILGERAKGHSTALSIESLVDLVRSFVILMFHVHILRVEGRRCDPGTLPKGTATSRKFRCAEEGQGAN